ncbi:MAG: exopolyphosphatase [Pedobacter sp.]|jgi:exopolyphosphatase/guanosine-5'-triphosphate,3'-diphosphate pyrophosphatase|uniref:Ppx/GppA phosphatase family protein n=1 Tax=Pedobacter sp. TaxID=1411316 RepID=UPI003561C1CC
MKLAVIDLGTNTFHLIIAEQHASELHVLYKTNQPVKLGENITANNLIIPTAFKRGLTCLKEFRAELDKHEVDVIKATATSGVRSAKNGLDFVEAAKKQANIEIDIIDGDEEAQYIYEGVKCSGAIKDKSLIMDIGGGSTEFILCDEDTLVWKKSYNIGAARLMQRFFKSDPINEADQQSIIEHLDEELKALKVICAAYKPKTLIGSAGAFETFAGMISPKIDVAKISTANISLPAYTELASTLIKATHNERANMKGLIPLRVDMIVMASLLTNYIINSIDIKKIKLSTYDLKMGVLQSLKV